jgi:hypothetical protein
VYVSVIDRITVLVELAGSKTKFARVVDLSVQTVTNMVNNSTSVRSDTLEAILKGYPNLSARWLLTGEGEMWTEEHIQFPISTARQAQANLLVPVRGKGQSVLS